MSPSEQESKTMIVKYAKKLPANTRDKLLRKIAKKNSYIKTLDNAFKQAIDINQETSFVEAATGRYNDQNSTKIETQINELSVDSYKCLWAFIECSKCFFGLQSSLGITNVNRSHNKPLELIETI